MVDANPLHNEQLLTMVNYVKELEERLVGCGARITELKDENGKLKRSNAAFKANATRKTIA